LFRALHAAFPRNHFGRGKSCNGALLMYAISDLGERQAVAALSEAYAWADAQLLGYHHPRFQALLTTILGDELRCLVVEEQRGGLCGVLPYRCAASHAGIVINAFPFFGCNGAVLARPGSSASVTEKLIAAFGDRARRADVLSAVLYTPFNLDPSPLIDILAPDEVLIKFTQTLDLSAPPVWPVKRRGDLRRAQRRAFCVRAGQGGDAAKVAEIYEGNCRNAGIPEKPRHFIEETFAIAEDLAEASPLRWLIAEREGAIVAALLYGQGPLTGSYILPCAIETERAHQPNALLLDEAIRRARRQGVRYWNFESSPQWEDPVFKFKKGWGAQASPFAVCVIYGAAKQSPAAATIAAARHRLPFYFVGPVGHVTGLWPAGLISELPYPALRSHLPRNALYQRVR
jgi:hypothetical protein